MKLFKHPQEIWNKAKCAKIAKRIVKNAFGDPYPVGLINGFTPYVELGQTVKYNGGCVRNNKWYNGEAIPLPKIHKDFEFVTVPTWGTRIQKKT